MSRYLTAFIAFAALAGTPAGAQELAPSGVRILYPAGAIKPNATWNVGARAGDYVFVADMRGFDPATNTLSLARRRGCARRSST